MNGYRARLSALLRPTTLDMKMNGLVYDASADVSSVNTSHFDVSASSPVCSEKLRLEVSLDSVHSHVHMSTDRRPAVRRRLSISDTPAASISANAVVGSPTIQGHGDDVDVNVVVGSPTTQGQGDDVDVILVSD